MTDKIQIAISRAAQAKALLSSELLKESLVELEQSYISAWRLTTPRDDDARERLWLAVQVVGKVRDHLNSVVDNGKLAQAELDAMLASQAA